MEEYNEHKGIDMEPQSQMFYSEQQILSGTIFGGPLAGGIFLRRNFINLGQKKAGQTTLIAAILIEILFVFGVVAISLAKPNLTNPALLFVVIYTALAYFIVRKYQSPTLAKHYKERSEFYPAGQYLKILFSCLLINVVLVINVYLLNDNFDTEKYDANFAEYTKNEEEALQPLKMLEENKPVEEVAAVIKNTAIPLWNNNLKILDKMDKVTGIPELYIKQNKLLRGYTKLRIEHYDILAKAITENTNQYDEQAQSLVDKILDMIKQLESNSAAIEKEYNIK